MNNSVIGKTMENLRKRVGVKHVRKNEEDKPRRLIASQSKMISNDQELIQSDPTSFSQNQKGNN